MDFREFQSADFQHFQNWVYWRATAMRLRDSAHALFRYYAPNLMKEEISYDAAMLRLAHQKKASVRAYSHDIASVALLYGAALENIFKAVIIFKDENLLNKKRLPKEVVSHVLIALAQKADVPLDDEEMKLLCWVTELVIWRGRYPVPTKRQHESGALEGWSAVYAFQEDCQRP